MSKRDEVREQILRIIHTNTTPVYDDDDRAVMSESEIVDQILGIRDLNTDELLETQAKITADLPFPAPVALEKGEEEEYRKWVKEEYEACMQVEDAHRTDKAEGIREVVDWIEYHSRQPQIYPEAGNVPMRGIFEEEWQAKLKSWNI